MSFRVIPSVRRTTPRLLAAAVALALALAPAECRPVHAALLISEVLYNEVGSDVTGEWIEIFNSGVAPIDLTDFKIGDEETKNDPTPPIENGGMWRFPSGAVILSGGLQIVAVGASRFQTLYGFKPAYEVLDTDPLVPNLTHYVEWSNNPNSVINLSNTTDQIFILDNNDSVVDGAAWGNGAFGFLDVTLTPLAGDGQSHERIDASVDTNAAAEWRIASPPTPGVVSVAPATWSNAAGGSWHDSANWQAARLPSSLSAVTFNLPNAYTVALAADGAAGSVSIQQGAVTLDLAGHKLNVNAGPLTVAASLTVSSGQLLQSPTAASDRLSVTAGGVLNVTSAGVIDSGGGNASIGTAAGASAAVHVSGLGSQWNNASQVTIGAPNCTSAVSVKNQATMSVKNLLVVHAGSTLDVGASPTAASNGFVNIGAGGPTALGTVRVGAAGTLAGSGTIVGNLLNFAGRLRPGNSPGVMTINGNFTQNDKGTLEIEIAGTAAADRDLVVVTPPGVATLNGTLHVPFLNGFTPTAGQEFTFLTAAAINGGFSSFQVKLPTGVAIKIGEEPEGPLQARQIKFISAVTELELKPQETPGPLNWSNFSTTWKNIANNDPARVPDTADNIAITNNSGAEREVQVQSANAFVNQLNLADSEDPFKVTVTGGLSLSAVDSATIGENAVISLDNGNFVSGQVDVTAGGTITGNGAIKTDELIVGATLEDQPAKFQPGLNGVGTTSIEGNLTLGVGSETTIDVASSTQFDKIDLQGTADFGGTLVVNVTNDATVQPGSTIQIVTATNLAEGEAFDLVRTVGSTDTVFVPRFTPGAVSATVSLQGLPRGDLSLDGVFNPAADAAALAQAFTNPAGYKASHQGTSGAIMGNVNNDDFFDFDDIVAFRQLAGMSAAELALIFQNAARVPEPSAGIIIALASAGGFSTLRGARRRR